MSSHNEVYKEFEMVIYPILAFWWIPEVTSRQNDEEVAFRVENVCTSQLLDII